MKPLVGCTKQVALPLTKPATPVILILAEVRPVMSAPGVPPADELKSVVVTNPEEKVTVGVARLTV